MKKKTYNQIRDIIYNNPRADKQDVEWDGDEKEKVKERMLYDNLIQRMKNAYQRNKRQKKIDKLQSNNNHWKGLS